jgi:hypothetical protein
VAADGSVLIYPNGGLEGHILFEVGASDESFDCIYVWAYEDGKYGVQVTESDGQLGLWVDGTGSWMQRSDFLHAWGITPAGQEVLLASPEPADGDIAPGQLFSYFVATNGAAKHVRKGKTLDGTVVKLETAIPAA